MTIRRNGVGIGQIATGIAVEKDVLEKYKNCLSDIMRIVSDAGARSTREAHWFRLSTMSADELGQTPALVQRALGPALSADRERWKNRRPLLDRNGKPFPGAHEYIAPTIAWAQIEVADLRLGLSLSDADCDGPNSAEAPDLSICSAIFSMQRGDNFRTRNSSVCYSGAGGDWSNEIAYD